MSVKSFGADGLQAAGNHPVDQIIALQPRPAATRPIWTILKNLFFFGAVIGSWYAVETGYFSNDRTSRHEWNEMERLKTKGRPVKAYEADFSKVRIDGSQLADGAWNFYNEATKDHVVIEGGNLVLNYIDAWVGSELYHTSFVPGGVYRVTLEAKVEDEPAAILMRNRQLDLMREEIPVSDGAFKTYTYHYVAPGGSRDWVRIILMPNGRKDPKGKMTVRKFLIERLEG